MTAEEEVIRRCRQRLAQIDDEITVLEQTRRQLLAEQDRLALTIEAAKDPSVLNRGGKR